MLCYVTLNEQQQHSINIFIHIEKRREREKENVLFIMFNWIEIDVLVKSQSLYVFQMKSIVAINCNVQQFYRSVKT